MIEADLFSHLSTNVELVNERVYPSIMPQGCLKPALVITIISNLEVQAINSREPYLSDINIQVDCWSEISLEALELRDAVQIAMHSFAHKAHGFTSRALYEPDTKLHRQLIHFNIKV